VQWQLQSAVISQGLLHELHAMHSYDHYSNGRLAAMCSAGSSLSCTSCCRVTLRQANVLSVLHRMQICSLNEACMFWKPEPPPCC
jgi:hypothetical protein